MCEGQGDESFRLWGKVKPASNQGAPLLKLKPLYPKQFSKGIALKQQFPQKMLQLLPEKTMILMSYYLSKLPIWIEAIDTWGIPLLWWHLQVQYGGRHGTC